MLTMAYFPTNVKRQMERDLHNLCQGDKSVTEYEKEFMRLLNCIPHVVRDDEDKARIFESGLRPRIFRSVQPTSKPTGRLWIAL